MGAGQVFTESYRVLSRRVDFKYNTIGVQEFDDLLKNIDIEGKKANLIRRIVVMNYFEVLYLSGAIIAQNPTFGDILTGVLLKVANDTGCIEKNLIISPTKPYFKYAKPDEVNDDQEKMLKYLEEFLEHCLNNFEAMKVIKIKYNELEGQMADFPLKTVTEGFSMQKQWEHENQLKLQREEVRKSWETVRELYNLMEDVKREWDISKNIMKKKAMISTINKFGNEGFKQGIRDPAELFWRYIDVDKIQRFEFRNNIRSSHEEAIKQIMKHIKTEVIRDVAPVVVVKPVAPRKPDDEEYQIEEEPEEFDKESVSKTTIKGTVVIRGTQKEKEESGLTLEDIIRETESPEIKKLPKPVVQKEKTEDDIIDEVRESPEIKKLPKPVPVVQKEKTEDYINDESRTGAVKKQGMIKEVDKENIPKDMEIPKEKAPTSSRPKKRSILVEENLKIDEELKPKRVKQDLTKILEDTNQIIQDNNEKLKNIKKDTKEIVSAKVEATEFPEASKVSHAASSTGEAIADKGKKVVKEQESRVPMTVSLSIIKKIRAK